MSTASRPVGYVTEEQYLTSSYEHDPELVDGQLLERPMPTPLHSWAQICMGQWFFMHRKAWSVAPLSELRTRIRPGRYRLPDVAVTRLRTFTHALLTEPLLVAIEILSPDDRFADLENRAVDFHAMGTEHIWLIDPELHKAFAWDGASWTAADALTIPGTPVYLDLPWLWEQLASEPDEA